MHIPNDCDHVGTLPMSYQIKTATRDDIPALKAFFLEAYGGSTILQDERVLLWYFGRDSHRNGALSCAVAYAEGGAIAAHYGCLPQQLLLSDGTALRLAWGVSAYTLPQHRDKGLGKNLLMHLLPGIDVFGVIGFTPKVASFYDAMGFHLFNKRRFKRFVFPLSRDILEIAEGIAIAREKIAPLLAKIGFQRRASIEAKTTTNVRYLSYLDFKEFALPAMGRVARIDRNLEYMKWRFFENPSLSYEMLGVIKDGKIKSYIVQRRELLRPTSYFATRIVDVNGEVDDLRPVVAYSLRQSTDRNDAFLEFGAFGNAYDPLFDGLGFVSLQEDDAAILPQVSDPIEARPNHEYVGLFSAARSDVIQSISEDSALFTRADSDRDRAARIPA
jgi:hypothetical protein